LILAALKDQAGVMKLLRATGCTVDIVSYWLSSGQGGPWLMPEQMMKLGRLGIPVWWDIYFADEDQGKNA
jgi:hypothetical protein